MKLIQDPNFKVVLDQNASSPSPDKSIWSAQHVCVGEYFSPDSNIPENPGEAVIKHQLKVKHWSVLNFGYAVLHFKGFPHDTVMQLVRHQDSKPLVQSMRYTGKRMMDLVDHPEKVEDVFYCTPVGKYPTRTGVYEVTEEYRKRYFSRAYESAVEYKRNIEVYGIPEEMSRRSLLSGYRQNFTMAGDIRAIFHWLDQRTVADSQIESVTLAYMALEELKKWSPVFFNWYEENRAGKNLLAP